MIAPDAGHDPDRRRRDARSSSPRRALELGIGTVYQHSTLIPALTVLENLMLGDTRGLRLDEAGARHAPRASSPRQLGVEVDPDAKAADLSLGAPAAGRDHQGALARLARPDPRRADLDAHAAGRRRAREGARPAEGAGPGGRLHHAQAPRGAHARRRDLDPPPGPRRRHDRPRDAALDARTTSCAPRSCGSCSATRRGASRTSPSCRRSSSSSRRRADRARRATPTSCSSCDGVSATGDGHRARHRGRLARAPAGRDPRRRRRRRQRPACARGGDRGPAPRARTATCCLFGAPIDAALGRRPRQKLGLRYVTDDRLGEGIVGIAPRRAQPRS